MTGRVHAPSPLCEFLRSKLSRRCMRCSRRPRCSSAPQPWQRPRIGASSQECATGTRASKEVHSFHDCSDDWTTGAQRALPMRFGPQIQTLLPREGRRPGQYRTGRRRGRRDCAVGGGGGSHPSPEAPHSTTLEDDHVAWLCRTLAHATQGRRRLERPSRRFWILPTLTTPWR